MRSPEEAVSSLRRARLHDRCVGGRLRMRLQTGSHQRELALVLGLRVLGGVRPRLQALGLRLLGLRQRELALVLGLRLLGGVRPRLFLCLLLQEGGVRPRLCHCPRGSQLGLNVLSPCLLDPHRCELALVLGLCLLLSVLSPCLSLCLGRNDIGRRAVVQLVVRPVTALCPALGSSAHGYGWRVFGAWRRKK